MSVRLDPFAIHYFLWFSALTSIYGYISVYAEHYANASSSQYGLLNMVLPFATIVAKLFFCSLADRHRAHRLFFVIFLIFALIGYGSFGILPFFIQPQPKNLGLNYGIWTVICLMTSIATISMGVISCLSDAFAVNSATKNNSSYGFIRVWGTIGWGLSALLISFINQTDKLPLLVPGLLMTILFLLTDIIITAFWPTSEDYKLNQPGAGMEFDQVTSGGEYTTNLYGGANGDNYGSLAGPVFSKDGVEAQKLSPAEISGVRMQWILFTEVARRRKSLFRYMTIFTVSGALISLQWSYFFLYLNNIYSADFSFISGLSMVGQSMVGELPFFILSKFVIQFLGRSHTLSVSIISIGVRYLLYEYLLPQSSMYFVLLTESLQGPSFGLFYVVMTEVGLDFSNCEDAIATIVRKGIIDNNPNEIQKLRVALCATMQSLMSACYEGLGLGIGSIIGGLVIDFYGFSQLWFWSSCFAITLGSLNILIEMMKLPIFADDRTALPLQPN